MARPPVSLSTPTQADPAAYVLEGSVVQAGDDKGRARRRDDDRPTCAVTAWHFSRGHVGRVDVSGLTLVVVGRSDAGATRRVLFLDEEAQPEQVRSLLDLSSGRLGIPWAGLISIADQVGAYQVPIEFDGTGVTVDARVRLALTPEIGEHWVEVPELDLARQCFRCHIARVRFLVEADDEV